MNYTVQVKPPVLVALSAQDFISASFTFYKEAVDFVALANMDMILQHPIMAD